MSEATDILIQLAERWGWGLLIFAFLLYQFYSPISAMPGARHTKLQSAFAKFHVLGVVVEAVAEEIDGIDEDQVHDVFQDNGYQPDDFKD